MVKIDTTVPRLGGTFRLFVSPYGTDVVRAMYLDLTGQPVEAPLATAWQAMRQGRLSFGAWRSSLEGVEETAYWAADNPGLLVRAMAKNVNKTFSRLLA